MKTTKFMFLAVLGVVLFFSSCKKEETETPDPVISNESLALAAYLESAESPYGKDFINNDAPAMITASDVKVLNETNQVYIIDIRSATDFAAGHIENAHNVSLAELRTHLESADLTSYTKIAIACYSGQTASFATSLMRLLGYDNVYALKWGMCSWNSSCATAWQNGIANTYSTQFSTTAAAKAAAGEMPVLSTGKATAQEILEARVDALLAEGFGAAKVSNTEVFGNLSGYYIVNYWSQAHYDFGHIPGAIQYTPKVDLTLATSLQTLPTDKPVVIYCYTGQTSAQVTAYLRLLGYDAKSLLYGANGMIYDDMVSQSMTHFDDAYIMGYDLVQ